MFLEILQNSQENTFARVYYNKVAGLRHANLEKFIRTPFLAGHLRWLLLEKDKSEQIDLEIEKNLDIPIVTDDESCA